MDGNRFDTLVKSVARRGATRRGFFGIAAGVVTGALGGLGEHATLAKTCQTDKDCEDPKVATKCCSGACRRIFNRTTDCGACNNVCLPTEECCGLACADLQSNNKNCGACSHACAADESCCGGTCRRTRNSDKNCGECNRRCKEGETCCGTDCVDPKNDRNHCGDCLTQCKSTEICKDGKCVKETTSTGTGPCVDLVAACLQPTDAALAGAWQIANSAWTDQPAGSALLPPDLQRAIGAAGGATTAALVTSRQVDDQGTFGQAVTSLLLACADEATATAIVSGYATATAGQIAPLESSGLPTSAANARVAHYDAAVDPTIAQLVPGTPAVEVLFQVGPVVNVLTASGDDAAAAISLASAVAGRLAGGSMPGDDLIAQLVFVDGIAATPSAWYSRLGGHPQRLAGVSDDDWTRQQATEGNAVDFARLSQTIPSIEQGSTYRLSTWAGGFASNDVAQTWLDGVPQRLADQNPGAQLVAIDEATGLGDASQGFLYAVTGDTGVALGVDLYARTGSRIVVVGLSLSAPSQTPGVAPLFADPHPLGKGAQAVLGLQLMPQNGSTCDPRGISVQEVFGESPLAVETSTTATEPAASGTTCCQYDCTGADPAAPPAIFCGPAGIDCPTLEQCTLMRETPFVSARDRCLAQQQTRLEACADRSEDDRARCETVANELIGVCNQMGVHIHAAMLGSIFCSGSCTKKACNPLCNAPGGGQCIGSVCPAGAPAVCDPGTFFDCTCQTEVVLSPPLSNSKVCDCVCDW